MACSCHESNSNVSIIGGIKCLSIKMSRPAERATLAISLILLAFIDSGPSTYLIIDIMAIFIDEEIS